MSRQGNTDTSYDVKEGHYLVGNRGIYKVWEFLGEGTFGKVAKCTKLGGHEFCAIKIMKRNEAGLREMESMKKIKHLDPEEDHLIEMYECFTFQNVVCFVYELLAKSLHDIVFRNPGLTHLCDIRAIAQHLLKALKALKSIGLAHCDIKLDNIMLADPRTTNIKLIDFGLALETKQLSIGTVIQVNPFRAPEVILGLPMDESVDMWALGMVLATAYSGEFPFPSETEYDTIRAMVQIHGMPGAEILNKAKYKEGFFTRDKGDWRLCTPQEYTKTTGVKVDDPYHWANIDLMTDFHERQHDLHDEDDHRVFLDLLKRMLEIDPQNRITPSQALEHDFITRKHLSGESKAKYAAEAEKSMGSTQISNPLASFTSSKSETSNGSQRSSDISSSGSHSLNPKTSVSSDYSSHSSSSCGSYSLSLETPAPDAAMTNVKDVKEVPSAGREDEPSVHSSSNSAQCEEPVSPENIENPEGLQTDRDQKKMSSKIEEEDESFVVKTGQSLEGHLGTYEVGELLGKGSYGRVFKCYKVGSEEIVAIKILENFNEGREEFKAMKLIKDLDPDQNNLMKFHERFSYNDATCLVYEILYVSLHTCLSKTDFHLSQIRAFAQQMFQALSGLKSIGVVHGDIKPDNILLVKETSLRIKLIDFGFAKKANKLSKRTEIQVTPFRAPEVMLGLPLDESIDMWAVGSVLACLYNGGYLFPCDTEYDTIRAMVQIFGLPEEELLNAGDFSDSFFTSDDDGWRLLTADEYTIGTGEQVEEDHDVDLEAIIQVHQDRFDDHDDDDHRVFIDLLKRMLEVNPQNRITPSQALAHDFITMKHLSGESKAEYAAISKQVMETVQFGASQ